LNATSKCEQRLVDVGTLSELTPTVLGLRRALAAGEVHEAESSINILFLRLLMLHNRCHKFPFANTQYLVEKKLCPGADLRDLLRALVSNLDHCVRSGRELIRRSRGHNAVLITSLN